MSLSSSLLMFVHPRENVSSHHRLSLAKLKTITKCVKTKQNKKLLSSIHCFIITWWQRFHAAGAVAGAVAVQPTPAADACASWSSAASAEAAARQWTWHTEHSQAPFWSVHIAGAPACAGSEGICREWRPEESYFLSRLPDSRQF